MNKLNILLLVGLFACAQSAVAQFTSVPIRLVTSTGTPLTGKADDIDFTKYPHSYPADVIGSITVTEIGTAGNYIAKGFTTFQYAKLWVDGTNQTWFDSVLTGNIFTYLHATYPRLSISNTFSGATNTFVSGIFSGSLTVDGPAFTAVDPYINDAGDPYLLYQHSQNSLVHVRLADSLYGRRFWYAVGDTGYRMHTGKFIYGRTNNTAPFKLNTSHFSWANDKLNLSDGVLNQDSIASKRYTNWVDSNWSNLGELVSKYRMATLKKTFWAYPSGYYDWKWHIQSVSESGTVSGKDSVIVVNHGDNSIGYSYDIETFGVDSWSNVDTVLLPERGTYQITYHGELIFPYTLVSGIDARDTVQFRIIREFDGFDNVPQSLTTIWKDFASTSSGLGSPVEQFYQPESNPISRTFTMFNQFAGSKWIVQIRADLNTSLINAAVTKPMINFLLIK